MKLKPLIILSIIAIILLPSCLAQIQDLKSNLIVNGTNELIQEGYITIIFCCGRIFNLHKYKTGYTERYAFQAENVICRLETYCLFPFFLFFRHYSNGEKLVLSGPCHIGIINDNFVCVFG